MTPMTRRTALYRIGLYGIALGAGAAAAAHLSPAARAAAQSPAQVWPPVEVWRSEGCGCCLVWADHLRDAGYPVRVTDLADMASVKARLGVPADLQSCHTALVDGYVVEGHVPATDIARLLAERPDALGLAVPGMPLGSPGMEMGDRFEPYEVILFSATGRRTFASHGQA